MLSPGSCRLLYNGGTSTPKNFENNPDMVNSPGGIVRNVLNAKQYHEA